MGGFGGSYHNLAALAEGDLSAMHSPDNLEEGGPLFGLSRMAKTQKSRQSMESCRSEGRRGDSVVIVSNHLPLRANRTQDDSAWEFEWDEDALIAQAKEGLAEDTVVLYMGSLPVQIEPCDEDKVQEMLIKEFNCVPVFLGPELKQKYYKGFCKLQLWPLFHYNLPLSPLSTGRFDMDMWQAYVKANKAFADRLVEFVSVEDDFVWIHDYHLLVLPSLLRRRLNKVRCGLFLHSPFPSSEIFRTFPKREEVLRSLLNADLLGFHTFDYARHFLSCCSRVMGLEHVTSRGAVTIEYYGRNVGLKIMPTGVKPDRLLAGYEWDDFKWRRGELVNQFKGQMVLMGIDDMDIFKGIELKLQALELLLERHEEWRGNLVMVQIINPARSSGREIQELKDEIASCTARVNQRFGTANYQPIVLIERSVPLHEKIAYYSIAEVVVVTALRDGMNLVPYEYIVSRQGPDSVVGEEQRNSMLVVSEFVGCSPSLSGAIRVNPWSLEAVADGMFAAIKLPLKDRQSRHEKHWKYVSSHTVGFWAQSFVRDLKSITEKHTSLKCYGLGLGLDTFRMVALDKNFRRLEMATLQRMYDSSQNRVFLLDYDGTLATQAHKGELSEPEPVVLDMLTALCAAEGNHVFIISGRQRKEIIPWLGSVPGLGLAAEHGCYFRDTMSEEWECAPTDESAWRDLATPIMQSYSESTDGSFVEIKESTVVWHYRDADPDFGAWQAKELVDHLEHTLSNEAVEVVNGRANHFVEVKPAGNSKGHTVERILNRLTERAGVDFVICIGDDRSDEDMFAAAENVHYLPSMPAEICSCTVGQKPSKAKYYLNDAPEVVSMLSKLVNLGGLEGDPEGQDRPPLAAPKSTGGGGLRRTK